MTCFHVGTQDSILCEYCRSYFSVIVSRCFFPGCSRFQWRQPWPTFRFIPSYDKADFAPLLPDNSAKVPQNMIYSPLIKWMQSQNSIISVYRRQWIFIMKRNIILHFFMGRKGIPYHFCLANFCLLPKHVIIIHKSFGFYQTDWSAERNCCN